MTGPLAGTRVLDLSRWIAGPHAGLILGDMGADVVKVESGRGDPSRVSEPWIGDESSYFLALNRSKRGIALDLRSPSGLDVLIRLIGRADVLIENFRPGTLSAMGIPAESLLEQHPRLVIASISGYGQTGPRSNIGAFDSIAQAASGLQMLTGMPDGPPVKSGFYVADYAAALHATIGILVALRARDQNGRGQHVDIALVESILSMSATLVPGYVQAGVEPSRVGNGSIHAAPVDVYRCRDGFVQLSASTDSLFQRLAIAMGRPDLPSDARFSSNAARMANANELGAMIADWAITLSANDVAAALDDVGVPASQIKGIREVVADEQLQARSFFVEQQHPTAGAVTLAGSPIGLSATPPDPSRPAPRLGEHTLEVLEEWLGISRGEALALVQSGDAPSPAAAAEHPLPE